MKAEAPKKADIKNSTLAKLSEEVEEDLVVVMGDIEAHGEQQDKVEVMFVLDKREDETFIIPMPLGIP